jgi:hypothetical protein
MSRTSELIHALRSTASVGHGSGFIAALGGRSSARHAWCLAAARPSIPQMGDLARVQAKM